MDESVHGEVPVPHLDDVCARLGVDVTTRARAAIAQLLHDVQTEPSTIRALALRDVSVLMADLRGFSALAAHWDVETLVALLQPFLIRMTEIIHDHGGFVDKFLGDGVMALFGAPGDHTDHTQRALACAAEMQCAVNELNQRNTRSQLPQLYAGIAVNSGEVMTGSFGSNRYREYTVIGDAVNITARMEKFALRGEVLLSERCYRTAREGIEIATSRQFHPRGFDQPTTVHALGAVTRPRRIDVPAIEQRASLRVPVSLPLRYKVLRDQRVLPDAYDGRIINIGYGGMLAKLAAPLPEASEIRFEFAAEPTAPGRDKVDARALRARDGDSERIPFAFTRMEAGNTAALRRYVDQILLGA